MYLQDRKNSESNSSEKDPKELLSLYLSLSPEKRHESFLNVKQTARWTGVCERTIRDWILYGKVTAIRVGERKWYIYLPSLKRYLEENQDKELAAEDAD